MKPEDRRHTRRQASLARVRMYLKKDLSWQEPDAHRRSLLAAAHGALGRAALQQALATAER